jgi:sodium-coupled neutral amino acid transporter 11
MEAPYVAEAERLERYDSAGEGRRFDIIKLPHIGGGIINSIVNMSNSIIGAGTCSCDWKCGFPRILIVLGIIGLPYAFNRAGLVLGIVLLFVLTGIVDWTIR